MRIYTPGDIDNELEIAKAEYLHAIVVATNTKIIIPKILDWCIRDFVKDAESLLDWVSEQLPNNLHESMQTCLASNKRQWKSLSEVVEVVPYDFSFRYLFAMHRV